MTPQEYLERLKKLRDQSVEKMVDQVIFPNGNELLANIKNRIVRDKKNSSGGSIGQYSIKPMYATVNQFDKKGAFKPVGKRGKTRKSMYLPSGYKQLREIQGKPTDAVNLNYTGSTVLSYQSQLKGKEVLLGLTNEESAKIRQGLENGTRGRKGYGKVFYATQQEMAEYKKNVAEDTKEIILKIFNA